jgi:hypothetical protein
MPEGISLVDASLGKLVNDFTGFFIPGSGVTKEAFLRSVDKNASVLDYVHRFATAFFEEATSVIIYPEGC